jgi:hypothetical protein
MITNRSNDRFEAWAIIEKRGNKLALLSGHVPIYWMRKVAQNRVDEFGGNYLHVEKITIHRSRRRRSKP